MRSYPKYTFPLILFLLAIVLMWQNASVPGFFQDGYLYSAFAKNAVQSGHWLVPHLSSATYSEFYQHTPFIFILQGLFFKFFGASYFVARIFVGVFFLILLFVQYKFLKREEGEWTAFLNGLLLILLPPLMKKLRFPNMDIPLMLSVYLSLTCYYLLLIKNKKKYWLGTGFFFGTSLLIKGPIGLFIPTIIFIHLLVTKKLVLLKDSTPWLTLAFGFAMFSIWPLSLHLAGKFYIFEHYLQSTFIHTAYDGRDAGNYSVITYVFFLFKSSPLWALLLFYSFKNFKINFKNNYFSLSLIASMTFLVLFSLMKFKYSHYLIPFYPFYVFVGVYSIKDKLKPWQDKITTGTLLLTILLTSYFAIKPMSKITRDPEIFEMLLAAKQLKSFPTAVGNVNAIYPFFALANLLAFEKSAAVYNVPVDVFNAQVENKSLTGMFKLDEPNNVDDKVWGFFVNKETYLEVIKNNPKVAEKFLILSYHSSKNMYFIIDRTLANSDLIINF